MNNKQLAEALRAISLDALPIKDRAAVLNAAEALEMGETQAVMDDEDIRNAVRDAISEAIGCSAYDCTRVWSAWGFGTMGSDDFAPIVDSEERLLEITDAAIGAARAALAAPAQPSEWAPVYLASTGMWHRRRTFMVRGFTE
ncbi:hypothetical protein ACQUFY_21710 [Robbsia andropogonis]|uniref:hypothetical protein n=1 Tax=Robbsia andropogonis TaxID=28092 RepID=UPI003D262CCF